jgi:hypothetical protein
MAIAVVSDKQLAAKLLSINTVNDVADILAGMQDHVWRPLGGKANNHPLVNALSDSGDALVERVTNGMDALIEREVLRSKRADFKSPREAADILFGIPGGHVVGLTDNDRRRELAGALIVTARESGVEKEPTIIVEDQGVGQHPSDFDKTLVSLNEENKRSSLYLMGAYGWGGAASFSFCKYAIFVSRRQEDLRRPGQDDEVGWTVIRYNELADDLFAKHGVYEYLSFAGPGGVRIPTFAPSALPPSHSDWRGTHCALVQYELSRFSEPVWSPKRGLWLLFNATLFDPIMPFLVRDERQKSIKQNEKSSVEGLVINGNAARLGWNREHRVAYKNSWNANFADGGNVVVRYWVLEMKKEAKADWEPATVFVPREQAVTITHNGQRQGQFRREMFETRLGLSSLAKYLIVHADCDGLSWHSKRMLFATTRDRLKENPLADELRKKVEEALQSDSKLHELDRVRKEAALHRTSKEQTDRINQLLVKAIESLRAGDITVYKKLLSSNPDLQIYGDQPLIKPEEPEPTTLTDKEPVPVYTGDPTALVVLNPVVRVPAGGKAVVRLQLDAPDGYIGVGDGKAPFLGVITKGADQFSIAGYSELMAGRMRCTISAETATTSDRGRVMFTVIRHEGLPLIDQADLEAIEPPVKRVKPAGKGPGAEKKPNVEPVTSDMYELLNFHEGLVARVEHTDPGPGLTTIYVNMDYPPMEKKLLAEKKLSEEQMETYKEHWAAAMALLAWLQDSQHQDSDPLNQDQREGELRRGAELYLFIKTVLG